MKEHYKRQFVLKLYFMTFSLQRLVHFHFSFYSKKICHSGTSYFSINVIPLKLFCYQTFFETWHNQHS